MLRGNCCQPFSATTSSRRSASREGTESLPSLCLVAISWAEAALTKIVVAGSLSSDEQHWRAARHQGPTSNAWVSTRTFTRAPAPPRISTHSLAGARRMTHRPRIDPSCNHIRAGARLPRRTGEPRAPAKSRTLRSSASIKISSPANTRLTMSGSSACAFSSVIVVILKPCCMSGQRSTTKIRPV